MLIKTALLHQSFGSRVFLSFSLSLSFWLIPWSAEAGYLTQGMLASSLPPLSQSRLRTTRFRSIKGPTDNGRETRTLALTTSVHHCSGDPCPYNKARKRKGLSQLERGGKALICRHNCVYIKKYNKNYLK